MANKKYIALDIGNVLIKVNLDPFILVLWEMDLVEDYDEGFKFLERTQAAYDIGIMNVEQSLKSAFPLINAHEITALKQAWAKGVELSSQVCDFIKNFYETEQGIIALLSNIGTDHLEIIKEIPEFNYCLQHFSCEVGARKPNKLFYQSFLIGNPEFKGALFFDDKPENVAAAWNVGLNAKIFNLNDHKNMDVAVGHLQQLINLSSL